MSKVISPQNGLVADETATKAAGVDCLPNELLFKILTFLGPQHLVKAGLVSQRWKTLSQLSFRNLTSWDLCQMSHVSDEAEFLSTLERMRDGGSNNTNLRHIQIGQSDLSVEFFHAIAESCPLLEKIDFRCTNITDRWWPLQNCPNVKDVSFVVPDEATHLTVDPEMDGDEGEAMMTVIFSLFSHWNDVQRVKVANVSGWAGYSVYEYLVLYLDYLNPPMVSLKMDRCLFQGRRR